MATLKSNKRYLNTYEGIYDRVSKMQAFRPDEWTMAANEGTMDMYAAAVDKLNKNNFDYDAYAEELNLDFADTRTRMTALYNAAFADTENKDKERTRKVFRDGQEITEKYFASDYDYTKELIKSNTGYAREKFMTQVAQKARDEAGFFADFLSALGTGAAGLATGLMTGIDNLWAFSKTAVNYILSAGRIDPVEWMSSDENRIFEDIIPALADFETEYSTMRNVDGSYSTLGKFIGGVMNSLGQMVPSMLLGYFTGGVGTAAGLSAEAVGVTSQIASQGSFYAGMMAGNVQDSYQQFKDMGADVDSASILANSAIKSALQWGIERGLGKILGGTGLDNMVFGVGQKGIASKGLTRSGILRVLKDAGQEGLEEVLQDTSDFLVNDAFSVYIDAYGVNNELTMQQLFDAAIMGAIASFAGSAKNIITTRRMVDVKGEKLNKIASYEYGVNMESFIKNSNEVIEEVKRIESSKSQGVTTDVTSDKLLKAAALETYAAYRMITSIYQEIGDKRFKKANELLDTITKNIKEGKYTEKDYTEYVETMKSQLGHVSELAFKKVVDELSKKDVTKVKQTVTKKDVKVKDKGGEGTVSEQKKKLEELLTSSDANSVSTTDGNVETIVDNDIIISEDRLSKESINEILQNLASQKLVSSVTELAEKVRLSNDIVEKYRKFTGDDSVDLKTAMTAILFDKSFFGAVLVTGNKDVYKFLSYFAEMEKQLVRGKLRDEIYRNKINEVRKHWFESLAEYAIIHDEADLDWTNEIKDAKERKRLIDRIKRERWTGDVYNRVVEQGVDALDKNEQEVLKKRFYNAFSQSQATRHWNNLSSDRASARQAAMNALSQKYHGLFNYKYDGRTYMPDTSVGNRVFNNFLKAANLTVTTLLDEKALSTADKVGNTFDNKSILEYRQSQFSEYTKGSYEFVIKNRTLQILYKGDVVGYTNLAKEVDAVNEGRFASNAVGETSTRNKELASLLRSDLGVARGYTTIDDVITEPDLLNNETRDAIKQFIKDRYGINVKSVDSQHALLYLRHYFVDKLKTVSIVAKHDGTYVFANIEPITDTFIDKNIKITKDTKLVQIFKPSRIPNGLKLKFVPGSDAAYFVPYKQSDVNGDNVTLFDNTIYIGEELLKESPEYVRFVVAHEFVHAVMFANGLNLGLNANWLNRVEAKQRKEIIADIRKHKPQLFRNVAEGSIQELNIAQDYVYHSTAESQAYGLEGSEMLDFAPVISQNVNNQLTLVMPWSKIYKIKNVEPITDVAQSMITKLADNLYQIEGLADLDNGKLNYDMQIDKPVYKFGNTRTDMPWGVMYESLITEQRTSPISPLIDEWVRMPENTDAAKSEEFKAKLKNSLTDEDKRLSRQLLHHVLAPDMPFDEFLETDVNFCRMQRRGHLMSSPFVSCYAGATQESIRLCLENFYSISSHRQDVLDTNMIVGTFKPKDILYYIFSDESEILIEPSKIVGSKIFKMDNAMHFDADALLNDYAVVSEDGMVIVNPEFSWDKDDHTINIINPLTDEILYSYSIADKSWENDVLPRFMGTIESDRILDDDYEVIENDLELFDSGDDVTINGITFRDCCIRSGDMVIYEAFPINHYQRLFFFSFSQNGFFRANVLTDRLAVTDPEGRVITSEEVETSFAEGNEKWGMSLARKKSTEETGVRPPNKNELAEDDKRAKNFISSASSPTAGYAARYYRLNEDGTQRLDRRGKPLYNYVYGEEQKKKRYVGSRKYAGTKLEPFTRKYKKVQIAPELQRFILSAEGLDPILQEKIDGKLKGTLTVQDVMDYFRSKETIDDKTFKAINDAFWQNKHITTFEELQNRIDTRMRESWALYRVFKVVEELRPHRDLLSNEELTFEWFYDRVSKKKEYLEVYAKLLTEYDMFNQMSIDIPDVYARTRYMSTYDGSVKSERSVASVVRLVGLLNWEKTDRHTKYDLVEAYQDVIEDLDMSRDEIIDAIKNREFVKKLKELEANFEAEGKSYEEVKMESLMFLQELSEELDGLSMSELTARYNGRDNLERTAVEGVVVDAFGDYVVIPDSTPVVTSSHMVNRMKGMMRTIRRNLTGKGLEATIKENSDIFEKDFTLRREVYQNAIKNKTRSGVHYENKTVDELTPLLDRIITIADKAKASYRNNRDSQKIRERYEKEVAKRIKEQERNQRNQTAKKIPKVVEIVTEGESFTIETNKEIPMSLLKILQVHYNRTAKTSVKNLSSDNERHIKMVSKTFLETNAENFNNLTQGDVDAILDFYLNTDVSFNNATAPYQVAEIWTLTTLIKMGRKGTANYVIDSDKLAKAEKLLKHIMERSAINMVTWRSALKELNPELVIANELSRKAGVEIDENDIGDIMKAIETRDMKKVAEAKQKVYDKYLGEVRKRYNNRKKLDKVLDRILQYERLAMLSGPGTWVRNWASNKVISGTNKVIDKLLSKLWPKIPLAEHQYRIAGTKVSNEVASYIEANLIDNKLLEMVIDSLSKYDIRQDTKGRSHENVLAKMISDSIAHEFKKGHISENKYVAGLEDFIRKRISDDKAVQKAALSYLGKMITEDLENGRAVSTEVLSENYITKNFMTYVAEAFKLAAYDYMHKPNFLFSLESQIARKSNTAYFMYKQIFPFAGASWNWFLEGLKYSPVGLAKAIYNYAKLENTIERMDKKRQQFEYNDVGVSSSFAQYLTMRDISKGVIGSVGTLIGILLTAFGIAKIDEEDDQYKLNLFDGQVKLDISEIFGTQGIFLGMAVTGAIMDDDAKVDDIVAAALDQMFMDSTFSDFFNTFRYSENFGDWLTYQPVSMLNMMIPNFFKTISTVTMPYQVKYSDGVIGKIERLAVNALPGLFLLFPHYYDPYTGEKQVSQKFWPFTKAIDKMTPLGLSVYNISDTEKMMIEQGYKKSQLSGRYTVNGESVRLSAEEVEAINAYYGKLNAQDIKELRSDSVRYTVERDGKKKNLVWSQMTETEKAAIVNRIMTNNSGYAKIKVLTENGDYKYYATDSEYRVLRELGIVDNIYRKTAKQSGFVKN